MAPHSCGHALLRRSGLLFHLAGPFFRFAGCLVHDLLRAPLDVAGCVLGGTSSVFGRFTGVLAGVLGQHHIDSLNRKTEIGYWLDLAHQGRGIVTRSTARLTDYAFNEQDCNRVVLHCALGNVKSRAVAERLGFVQEEILREAEWLNDHYVDLVAYSMLKSQWRKKRGLKPATT